VPGGDYERPARRWHPRLLFALGGHAPENTEQREFELLTGVTVIGSGTDVTLARSTRYGR
jgi:hypothetical protein